ncbi:hypothetical protein [Spirulina subsalsa]|uniref:hypothetical protein n=1 Tax=Spirulina subsalsa TaxID=54311 RepID=UPI0002D655CE|nr:hypothetical protein [Spirulina subsalsa]
MLVKGIKRGKTIELLEEIDVPDEREVLLEIKEVPSFWTVYQNYRARMAQEGIVFEDEMFENLRDRSVGREVDL